MSDIKLLNAIFVVEGKNDSDKLQKLGVSYVVTTEGTKVPRETINHLIALESKHKIIILTDPDKPGQKIAEKLVKHLMKPVNIKLTRTETAKKGTIGVENMTMVRLEEIIKPYLKEEYVSNSDVSYFDLVKLGLNGPDSQSKRVKLTKKQPLIYSTLKKMFVQILLLDLSLQDIKEALDD